MGKHTLVRRTVAPFAVKVDARLLLLLALLLVSVTAASLPSVTFGFVLLLFLLCLSFSTPLLLLTFVREAEAPPISAEQDDSLEGETVPGAFSDNAALAPPSDSTPGTANSQDLPSLCFLFCLALASASLAVRTISSVQWRRVQFLALQPFSERKASHQIGFLPVLAGGCD